ncbi:MAG: hypothetical protein JXA99_03595 [Candidatus Lokiarchaeota archaeon]|nr:hypothetical protein [Candidatus Lokiarchaeota archaeon]
MRKEIPEEKSNIPDSENQEFNSFLEELMKREFIDTLKVRAFVLISIILYAIMAFYLFPYVLSGELYIYESTFIEIIYISLNWTLIIVFAYLLFLFVKLYFYRSIKRFVHYIKKDVFSLGFTLKNLHIGLNSFIIINIAFYFFCIICRELIYSLARTNYFFIFLFFIIFLILCVFLPVIFGFYQFKIKIPLKNKKHLKVNFRFKYSVIYDEYDDIFLYLRTNRVCLKLKKIKSKNYQEISKKNWFPQYGRFKFLTKVNIFHYFFEFSTPINFQNKILNLLLALKDWEKFEKN